MGYARRFVSGNIAKLTANKLHDNTRVYLGCGELDRCWPGSTGFAEKLNALNLPNLEVKPQLVELLGHSSVAPISFTYGLQFVFERPLLNIDKKIIEQYAGHYAAENGFSVDVIANGQGLLTRRNDGRENNWLAESSTKFYALGSNITLEFVLESDGKYAAIIKTKRKSFKLDRKDQP